MRSAANPQSSEPPEYQERRQHDDMPGQQQPVQTQDVVIDRLTDRLSAIFQPQLKDIKDQLANLVTRREHEKDLAEVTADMTAHQRQLDRLQSWADVRPRESADANWVKRIEADVATLNTWRTQQPEQARATLNTLFGGGGCLYMVLAFAALVVFGVINVAVSVGVALLMRGG